jgi:toxin ParE1/3/4
MAKYKLSNKAVDDLTGIWNYTFDKWSENQADKYYFMLLENCNEVAFNPALGKNHRPFETSFCIYASAF